MKTNQNGRSMIEMLGVLAIIGVLTVGGILGYTKAMAKYRSNKVIDQITLFITNIRTMYAAQQTYINLSNSLAIDLNLTPDELVVRDANGPTGVLRNVFSGNVQVAASGINVDGDNGAFVLTFYGLSRDACIAIATSDWGSGSSSGLVAVHYYNDASGTEAATALTAANTGGAPATGSNAVVTPANAPAPTDDTLNDVFKTAAQSSAKAESGNYIGVPGDPTVTVPLTVDQAMAACTCRDKATCAASFKYF